MISIDYIGGRGVSKRLLRKAQTAPYGARRRPVSWAVHSSICHLCFNITEKGHMIVRD